MALGKASEVIISAKSLPELFAAAERAMRMIGMIIEADPQAGRLSGSTKYGFQKVKLDIEILPTEAGTQLTVNGSGDDAMGVGATHGVARLLEVIDSPDRPAGDADYLKRGMSKSKIALTVVGLVVLLVAVIWIYLRLT
jgi:hypothetical protein